MTALQNSPNDDVNDDSPRTELQLGIRQKNISANGNPKREDYNGFIETDKLLAVIEKSISASMEPNSGGMTKADDNRTRSGNPINSSRSTIGSTQGWGILRFSSLARTYYSYDPWFDYNK